MDLNRYKLVYRIRRVAIAILLLGSQFAWWAPKAWGITPDNPRVQAAIRRAIEFLESKDDARLGGKSLVALALSKSGKDASHPKIAAAIAALQAALGNGPEQFRAGIYDTGIAIMLLVQVDASRYRYEIESLVQSLHLRQKADGAWGYPPEHPDHGKTCDTSMTQYAILGLWEAEDLAGVETPRLVWDRVARWLLLTQDPGGGFGYQGQPAARLGRFEQQGGVRASMTIAALGSLYIVKDRVGITQLKKNASDDTPDAFVPYESPEERAARIKTLIDLRHFARALASGNRWLETNVNVDEMTGYVHYALYALERYESLREAEASGRSQPVEKTDESPWYNRGAKFLLRTQKLDGSWESQCGSVPDTCFSVLFLLGSTRKVLAADSVARYTASTLIGGQGLPDTSDVRLRAGQVVVRPLELPLDQVLAILDDAEHPDYPRAVESLADAASALTPPQLEPHVAALVGLARRSPTEVRLLAVQCLGRTKNLTHVPWLILLLRDDDARVAHEAATALGQLSRKFDTMGLTRRPTERQRETAVEQWKAWYHAVRPDVDLDSFSYGQPSGDE